MERESLLAILSVLLGGAALQLLALWPVRAAAKTPARRLERRCWFALWRPFAVALTVVAWLCGWALSQPDPVPEHVGWPLLLAAAPFAVLGGRALMRALVALVRRSDGYAIVTVGLWRPRIVMAAALARALDPAALRAALAHEQAHVRHRDPLRIWLAQCVTDLQWPSAAAARRFEDWLAALEQARDDEARASGIEGADLAAAVLGSLRFQSHRPVAAAALIGRNEALPARIARLLRPLGEDPIEPAPPYWMLVGALAAAWSFAIVLGLVSGERLVRLLLAAT